MSISITFNGETPEDIQREISDWHNLLIAGACAISDDRAADARAATAREAEVRAAKEEAQRAETNASNAKALKALAAQLKEQEALPLDVAAVDGDEAPTDILTITDPAGPAGVSADVPDYAIVREAVLRLAVVKTPEITRAVLDRYGVRRAADLDPSRWNDLLADVNAAMA
jgi:hypothetical protein